MVLNDCFKSAGPGRVSLPYLPGGLCKTAVPFRGGGPGALFSIFFVLFSHAKKRRKTGTSKNSLFFVIFGDFGWPRRRFLAIFGPKTGPRRLLFRCFFENGDFVKIVLPLRCEHNFEGLDPPKIDPENDSERQRREKTTKMASDGFSGALFSFPARFFVDFR